MKFRSLMTAICVLATASIVSAAPFAYVANSGTKNVSVIDTADNTIKATVALPGTNPYAYSVAVGASGQYVYVGLQTTKEIVIIDTATNTVLKRIGLGVDSPGGLAVNAAESRLYVASNLSNTLIVIDITWTPTEVGRVTVGNNPEGVILSPAGDKAYVASATTGTVAEIALDETHNTYTNTSTTPLGISYPFGLAISSDGNKLYISGNGGTAAMMNTSTKNVTLLPVAFANGSVAITPDDSKVYAPAFGTDEIFVIDAAADPNVVQGTSYPVSLGPKGSSLTPDGSKLYLAMNGSDNVKVFDTATNTVTATIALPAGAKPISAGNFIGPAFTNTITSSNGSNCTISPLGAIAVNENGRTFTITPTGSATCDVKVDGVSVGQPSAYAFTTPVLVNHTIDASEIPTGTYYTLSGDWISSVGGYLVSTTTPSSIGISKQSKSAKFAANTTVTLKAGSGFQVQSGTWTGACAGTVGSTCSVLMDADKTFGTTTVLEIQPFVPGGPIYNVTKNAYYTTLAAATGEASTSDIIKISTDYTLGGLTTGTAGVQVKMSSQWKAPDYTALDPTYVSPGAITITDVAILADGLVI